MKRTHSRAVRFFASVCLTLGIAPSFSLAQQNPGGAGRGAMLGQMPQQLQQVLDQLDLSPEQKTKIDAMIKKTQQDVREARQGLQDATPEERRQKMQDIQKMMGETKTQVEGELTSEQKTKYYPLVAKASLKRLSEIVAGMKSGVEKSDVAEEQKKSAGTILDEAQKVVDGMKPDSEAVKDADGATDFQDKIVKEQQSVMRQLLDTLGQDDMRTLVQSVPQLRRPGAAAGGATGAGGGGRVRRPNTDAAPKDAPATQPAAK